ncbi:MAG TPA: biotin/lipoyl-binding carrier protein [Nocardioidaceae bacterium]|nr:biotin/lipoyl-binding carrier protein [Nocardioidaceae bacterium]
MPPVGDPATSLGHRMDMAHLVYAELVANVWKVVAQAGDRVRPDDPLVILESMKMEIPVPAEVSGTVTELSVKEGEVVHEGDQIAEIAED